MNAAGTFVFREIMAICRQKLQIRTSYYSKYSRKQHQISFSVTDLDYEVITMYKLPNKLIFIVNNGLKAGKKA